MANRWLRDPRCMQSNVCEVLQERVQQCTLAAKGATGPTVCATEHGALNRCLMAAYAALPPPETPQEEVKQMISQLRGPAQAVK